MVEAADLEEIAYDRHAGDSHRAEEGGGGSAGPSTESHLGKDNATPLACSDYLAVGASRRNTPARVTSAVAQSARAIGPTRLGVTEGRRYRARFRW